LCEIGCYTGIFLEQAREKGWDVCGVELSNWARGIASGRRGVRCYSSVEEVNQTATKFDGVVMWDVIEHVPEPRRLVSQAAAMLKPGGVLGLSTIVLDSLSARVLRGRYPFLMEMHLIYFTRRTLTALLEECGLEIVLYKRHRRYVTLSYALGKYPVFSILKRIRPLWAKLGGLYFVSSVGLRDVFARKTDR
jgi:2-polyprenyl-3-methyl-5-hydroxy-6-metoxy-1,4-benzoquinol methylase